MKTLEERFYPETRFGGFTHVDGTVAFYTRVNALLNPTDVVLDIGCGRGASHEDPITFRRELRILKGKVAKVIGIDVDSAGGGNSFVDEFRLIRSDSWPLEEESIDIAVGDYVLEHVADPEAFFAEAARVIKPGGYMCIRTPNRNSYFGLAATFIPNRFHARITRRLQCARHEDDVFPTLYRCNTRRRLRQVFNRYGFDCVICSHETEPAYLYFSGLTYFAGVLHQRMSPAAFKLNLLAFGQRRRS